MKRIPHIIKLAVVMALIVYPTLWFVWWVELSYIPEHRLFDTQFTAIMSVAYTIILAALLLRDWVKNGWQDPKPEPEIEIYISQEDFDTLREQVLDLEQRHNRLLRSVRHHTSTYITDGGTR